MTRQEFPAITTVTGADPLTQRHDQQPHVVEPVGRFVGELRDEELQDGPEVTLAAHRHHFDRPGHGRVTVTAVGREREREGGRERERERERGRERDRERERGVSAVLEAEPSHCHRRQIYIYIYIISFMLTKLMMYIYLRK